MDLKPYEGQGASTELDRPQDEHNNNHGNSNQSNNSHGQEITSRVSPWLARLAYPLGSRVVLPNYFGKVEITGEENLPKQGAVVFAPTHRSRWDALIVPFTAGRRTTGRDLRFMVTADEMKGIQGWLIRRLGGFPVNTRHPSTASLRHGIELLEEEEALVIFPEGNIYRQEHIQPLKPGIARLALHAELNQPGLGVRIVPISIHYSDPVPHWGTDVEVRVGKPLKVGRYCTQPLKNCAQQLRSDLENALKRLHPSEVCP